MKIIPYAMLAAAAAINAAGSGLFKYAALVKKGPGSPAFAYWLLLLAAMACYGACFPLYAVGLSRLRLSVAQPIFSAFSFAVTALIAVLLFGERLNLQQILGIAAILGGIVLVAAGKPSPIG